MDQDDRVKPNQPNQVVPQAERVPYQKPAVAWEEPFQQVVAQEISCALTESFGPCLVRVAT
jgi:hypothetical protein